jgi:hypothetical protein
MKTNKELIQTCLIFMQLIDDYQCNMADCFDSLSYEYNTLDCMQRDLKTMRPNEKFINDLHSTIKHVYKVINS